MDPDSTKSSAKSLAKNSVLARLCRAQLRVGLLGFGGPLATMSMMRDELVEREKLLPPERYLEGLGVVKLLPGPVSTLLSIFLGQEVFGFWGGLCSGLAYIFPSFVFLLLICQAEDRLGPKILHSSHFLKTMNVVQAAVIGVIIYTCWKLFFEASLKLYAGKRRKVAVSCFALIAAVLALRQTPEILILVSCAFTGWLSMTFYNSKLRLNIDPLTVFLTFFWAGFTVFGTGYMILPYLQRILVVERHWLDLDDFLKGVAYGNLTPGPIVIACTYFGQKILGFRGALIATFGIFAGPFVLMLSLGPVLKRFLGKAWIEGVLLGLLPAVAATITVSLLSLSRGVTWNLFSSALALLALIFSGLRWPAWKLLALSALAGLLSSFV